MNSMKIQEIKNNQKSKCDEIIEYLKQDDRYWLENDKWNVKDKVFGEAEYKVNARNIRFDFIKNEKLKNEVKYYFAYSLKNKFFALSNVLNQQQFAIKYLISYVEKFFSNKNSFNDILIENSKWKLFLINEGLKLNKKSEIYSPAYRYIYNVLPNFIKDFYDEREETEKDIWDCRKIKGAKYPATGRLSGNTTLNFMPIPLYYREEIKRYFRTKITKRSYGLNEETLKVIKYFFNIFYSNDYTDGFIENLSRQDIEKYLYWVNNDFKNKNLTYKSKFVSYVRTFLEYIQMAQYDKSPKKEVSFLIFQDDIPKRERPQDEMRRIKFVPEPILKQLDNNIMDLDRIQFIPIYILLRETGWRGTDVLNLRYHNCLEQT